MCGIAGFLEPGGLSSAADEDLQRMMGTLVHRGPDGSGIWKDAAAGVALGHRRLAILELSPAGAQPMVSASGRFVITFNGEIYNHLEMRADLEGAHAAPAWRGHSDTETLLAALDRWGLTATLERTVGMFAFALWNRQTRTLMLARDRLGEKPLFYGWQGATFLFGSELKALRSHRAFHTGIDRTAVARYVESGYVPAPHSIYQGISKLPSGTYLEVPDDAKTAPAYLPRAYWSLGNVIENGMAKPFSGDRRDARDELEAALKRAIGLQSIADVSLGAFLSGGIDSSTVVALMQSQSSMPVQTFTVGFREAAYQEAEYAKNIARVLGTTHTELYVTPAEAMDVIPKLPTLYDEPFGDSSAIPTFVVAQFARRHVKVCLSGDGGDELFGGYSRYQGHEARWRSLRRIPWALRRALAGGCRALARSNSLAGWRAGRLAVYLATESAQECYRASVALGSELDLVDGLGAPAPANEALALRGARSLYDAMMYADTLTYLPDDVLTKVDRAAMGVSLETRVPMLDHRIVELAWRLPLSMKVVDGRGKQVLRDVLARYIPTQLFERPKMGFGVPVGEWLRGPLRNWGKNCSPSACCNSRVSSMLRACAPDGCSTRTEPPAKTTASGSF